MRWMCCVADGSNSHHHHHHHQTDKIKWQATPPARPNRPLGAVPQNYTQHPSMKDRKTFTEMRSIGLIQCVCQCARCISAANYTVAAAAAAAIHTHTHTPTRPPPHTPHGHTHGYTQRTQLLLPGALPIPQLHTPDPAKPKNRTKSTQRQRGGRLYTHTHTHRIAKHYAVWSVLVAMSGKVPLRMRLAVSSCDVLKVDVTLGFHM
mmetsp:Transcript_6442/g.15558  ORF Transcript_6442/g.15558 Transcript_6442/m.15558 type:complete len:205 (+) Transcript_6442:1948-2562(+)